MRKYLKKLVFCFLIVSILLQSLYNPMVYANQPAKTMTILFTHDMHDNLLPIESEESGVTKSQGGYARLKSAIDLEKEADKEALLVDGGDYSMGTPFQTIFQSDSPELRIMGQMGYDVTTFGNHEFDYRATGLAESLNAAVSSGEPLPQIVQSNITYPADESGNLSPSLTDLKQAMKSYGVKDYTVIERNGIKIGIFGVMGKDSADKAPMSEVQFEDEIDHAKRVVKLLKEKEGVDFILCLSHSGTWVDKSASEDEILAKKVPEINAIVSGHTHAKLSQPIIVGDTIIASAGNNGMNLGVMKFSKQTDTAWELNGYELKPIDDNLSEDENISRQVNDYKAIVEDKYFSQFNRKYDEVIAKSSFSFPTIEEMYKLHDESTLGDLISDAFIYTVKKAEGENYIPITAAIVPIGTIRATIPKGNITTADAFTISSLGIGADKRPGYPLISVYLTGKELKTVCEVDASIAPIMDDAQLYMSGLNFTFNPKRLIFNKVVKTSLVKQDGTIEEINDTKLYRIVVGLYSAQMLSVVGDKSFGLMTVVPKAEDGTPIADFEKYILYDPEGNELKEWSALVTYLESFDKENGVSTIPQYYSETQDRKVVDNNGNIFALLNNPNHIAVVVYAIILVIFILIITVIIKLVKRKKRKSCMNKQ